MGEAAQSVGRETDQPLSTITEAAHSCGIGNWHDIPEHVAAYADNQLSPNLNLWPL
jgi:hypothetical protein